MALRKRSLHDKPGAGVDDLEAEGMGASTESSEDSLPLLLVVVHGGVLLIAHLVSEHSVDEDGELSRGGGDGFGFPDARAHATVESAEGVIASPEAHRCYAEDLGGAVRRRLGS